MSRLLIGKFGCPQDFNTKKFSVTSKTVKEVLLREKLMKGTAKKKSGGYQNKMFTLERILGTSSVGDNVCLLRCA